MPKLGCGNDAELLYQDRILKRRIPVDSQANDGRHDVPSTGHQPSSSEGNISWRAVLSVLLILLVGAVVGHGLLKNPAAAGKKLPCGQESACAGCPSSQACQADPDGAVAKPQACPAGCDAAGCPGESSGCPLAASASGGEPPCCAMGSPCCAGTQNGQAPSCCPASAASDAAQD